jgi:hypothetical protein
MIKEIGFRQHNLANHMSPKLRYVSGNGYVRI